MSQFSILLNESGWALVLAALLGLAVGSFLNVVIHRLPLMVIKKFGDGETAAVAAAGSPLSLAMPASHCPNCKHRLAIRDNIPLVSFTLLRGRCRFCRATISLRYPMVELLCTVMTTVVVFLYGFGWTGMGGLVLTWTLIALAFIDLETGLLPDSLTLGLVWLGLLFSVGAFYVDAEQAVLGALAGYLSLWLLNRCFKLAAKKEGLGYGDMKLTAALGAWMGWQALPPLLMAASLMGLLIGLLGRAVGRIRPGQQIPFGPYLAMAGWLYFCLHKQWPGFFAVYAGG